ncbi:MAG: hypothetical protein ABI383_07710 [Acidobacteriaceae bacterium]
MKVLKDAHISIQQAELILKLYELRREAVMRAARSHIGGPFLPGSVEELVRLVSAGDEKAGYILQVYGYWDMVAAFVIHGALDRELVYDTCQEMYFQYAKIQPYLAEFRKEMKLPEFMRSIEAVVEGSAEGRKRLGDMRRTLDELTRAREGLLRG